MHSASPPPENDAFRVLCCPECGRVASVPERCKRPICVHSWDGYTPEIWDADAEGDRIEDSPNERYRTPGPDTWTEMVPYPSRSGRPT